MKGLLRRIMSLSLVLLLGAVLVLHVRSFGIEYECSREEGWRSAPLNGSVEIRQRTLAVNICDGTIKFSSLTDTTVWAEQLSPFFGLRNSTTFRRYNPSRQTVWATKKEPFWNRAGFFFSPRITREFANARLDLMLIGAPLWLIELLLAAWPFSRVVLLTRRRWRSTHGKCVDCGYDLRDIQDRCPECGGARKAL